MKKKLAKLCIFILILAFVLPMTVDAEALDKTVRIGLNFGSDTVVVANLSNVQGTGYRFGYYDGDRLFHALGETEEGKISVMKTRNLYLNSSGLYVYEGENAVGVVGCFHIQLPGLYEDFESAKAVADQLDGGFVAWVEGEYSVRVGAYDSRVGAEAAVEAYGVEGAAVGETSAYGYSVVATGTTRILFQFDGGQPGETYALGVQPGLEGDVKAITRYKEREYYGGFRFERIDGGDSTVVNMIGIEDYVKGIVPYEMSPSWPLEALKAQAVCARTYAFRNTNHRSYHFDMCTTMDCQAYKGVSGSTALTDQAVDETLGEMARYDGKPIDAVYFSSDGGSTEDSKNVWGGELPYLKGVIDPYEEHALDYVSSMANYKWTKTYTLASLKQRLHEVNCMCGDLVCFSYKKSPTGNVIEFTVQDVNGTNYTFSRAKVASVLRVNSIHFDVTISGEEEPGETGYVLAGQEGTVPDTGGFYAINGEGEVSRLTDAPYVITAEGVKPLEPVTPTAAPTGEETLILEGRGWGHNVGMSQWGAFAMAKMGFDYRDILTFYYTGITVE